jgi:O-antigen ligase
MISLIITIFYYLAVIHNDKLSEFSDNPVIKIKLVSLGIRLDIQNKGINQIINDSNYLTGSGINTAKKTNDLNLNLHNTYLQMFLEMGLITFGIVFLSLIIVMFNINILFLPLFSVMFVLGNFLEVFYFPLLIFILFLSKDYDFKERVK